MIELLLQTGLEAYEIRALVASALVGVVCGVLGCFIVLRNMALIGDALSHAILPGVVVGFWVAGHSVLAFFTGSVLAGLVTAVLITWLQRNVKTKDDSAIGIVFSVMFALGIIGISWLTRREGVHLDMKDFLFGNVLGVSDDDLKLTGLICLYVVLSVIFFYRYLMLTTFQSVVARTMGISTGAVHYFLMLLLSFTVVAALQSVGVILVVAMLIIPASTALLLSQRLRTVLFIAAAVGLVSTSSGLFLAIVWDTTPGPMMTLTAAACYVLAALFARKRGLLYRWYHRMMKRKNIHLEDVLKACVALHEGGLCSDEEIIQKTGFSASYVRSALKKLAQKGLVQPEGDHYCPTQRGIEYGYRLIRAHRVWETYMVEKMGQNKAHIHPIAERYEHLLPEEFIAEVEADLGHPETDPHGSLIPRPTLLPTQKLTDLHPHERAVITLHQPTAGIASRLWEEELFPNTIIELERYEHTIVIIKAGNRVLTITEAWAQEISVRRVE
jgi:ABC-type Mn2+/Zn2+ transport system permease subunit/Mn-dependent DtxR family transcriptional regulator